jgi:hypothetical protein
VGYTGLHPKDTTLHDSSFHLKTDSAEGIKNHINCIANSKNYGQCKMCVLFSLKLLFRNIYNSDKCLVSCVLNTHRDTCISSCKMFFLSDFNQNRSVVLQLSNVRFHRILFSGYRVSHGRAEQINAHSGESRKRLNGYNKMPCIVANEITQIYYKRNRLGQNRIATHVT